MTRIDSSYIKFDDHCSNRMDTRSDMERDNHADWPNHNILERNSENGYHMIWKFSQPSCLHILQPMQSDPR